MSGRVQAAFMLAPLVMDLTTKKIPIKIVSLGHRSGAVIMVRTDSGHTKFKDLTGKRIAIPSRFAVDFLFLRKMLKQEGMSVKEIEIIEMPPPDMPAALYAKAVDAYCTGEPFGAAAQKAGYAIPLRMTRDEWRNYICCVLSVREELMASKPALVQELVNTILGAGVWLDETAAHRTKAAEIAAGKRYFNQDKSIIQFVMDNPADRVTYGDLRMIREEFDELMQLSVEARTRSPTRTTWTSGSHGLRSRRPSRSEHGLSPETGACPGRHPARRRPSRCRGLRRRAPRPHESLARVQVGRVRPAPRRAGLPAAGVERLDPLAFAVPGEGGRPPVRLHPLPEDLPGDAHEGDAGVPHAGSAGLRGAAHLRDRRSGARHARAPARVPGLLQSDVPRRHRPGGEAAGGGQGVRRDRHQGGLRGQAARLRDAPLLVDLPDRPGRNAPGDGSVRQGARVHRPRHQAAAPE